MMGTYMAWVVNNNGWWGEGEIKFNMTATRNTRRSAARAPMTIQRLQRFRGPGDARPLCAFQHSLLVLNQVITPNTL
jgi:hypothetical protein